MLWPIRRLTFRGAIVCATTLSTVKHFLSLYLSIRKGTRWIAADAHLGSGFHFFVLFIQAFAGDALSQEADEHTIVVVSYM